METRFRFVTDGPKSALDQARAAAGDRDVLAMGGADIAYEFPRLELRSMEPTDAAAHLTYRVLDEGHHAA